MKGFTKVSDANGLSKYCTKYVVFFLLNFMLISIASAQSVIANSCTADFDGLWIIDQACQVDSSINVKSGDAININCNDGAYSISFFIEPEDGASQKSDAVEYGFCPGNAQVNFVEGQNVLSCNFWGAGDQVAKQLEVSNLVSEASGQNWISWLVRDIDNPNRVCGISGRPDDGKGTGTGRN